MSDRDGFQVHAAMASRVQSGISDDGALSLTSVLILLELSCLCIRGYQIPEDLRMMFNGVALHTHRSSLKYIGRPIKKS